jgi:hypothetical protein
MQFQPSVHILTGFHSAQVLVLGDVMLDRFEYGTVERISAEAPSRWSMWIDARICRVARPT